MTLEKVSITRRQWEKVGGVPNTQIASKNVQDIIDEALERGWTYSPPKTKAEVTIPAPVERSFMKSGETKVVMGGRMIKNTLGTEVCYGCGAVILRSERMLMTSVNGKGNDYFCIGCLESGKVRVAGNL
jgi:hypothetical protein